MARAATTSDVFNAIAEPRRRAILDVLLGGERAVNEIVDLLGVGQAAVSKHLRVLKEVGLVRVRRDGRQRVYRAEGKGLETVHDWTKTFDSYWESSLQRVKASAERTARESG